MTRLDPAATNCYAPIQEESHLGQMGLQLRLGDHLAMLSILFVGNWDNGRIHFHATPNQNNQPQVQH